MAIFVGDDRNERIDGSGNDDLIVGLGGDDRLLGGAGDDVLFGNAGTDRLQGGRGDDLLFVDPDDDLVNGGADIDVAILDGTSFNFERSNMRNVEGIQDRPGNDTSVTFDPDLLATADLDHFTFALGDGDDEVRLLGDDLEQVGDNLVWDDRVVLDFEGVERIIVVDSDDGHSRVISLTESPADSHVGDVAGPGSTAAKAALAADIFQDAEITQHADLLRGKGDIDQTAEIIQKALGRGDIDQFADIIQDARSAGGDIDQKAVIDQIAKSFGGDVSQVSSIVQDALTFGLGDVTQEAAIDQSARSGGHRSGDIDQEASITQSARSSGSGDISQSASIEQSARSSGGGDVSQSASITQSAVSVSDDGAHGANSPIDDYMFVA